MSYVLLVLEREDRTEWPPAKARHAHESMVRFREALERRGLLKASEALRPASEGVRLEVRAGKRLVVDGPFAESKEIVGGFFLLDCATRDAAVAIASECPATEWATVEVREVGHSCLPDGV